MKSPKLWIALAFVSLFVAYSATTVSAADEPKESKKGASDAAASAQTQPEEETTRPSLRDRIFRSGGQRVFDGQATSRLRNGRVLNGQVFSGVRNRQLLDGQLFNGQLRSRSWNVGSRLRSRTGRFGIFN